MNTDKGSAGVDGMQVKDLDKHLKNNRDKIESEIRRGQYLPQANRNAQQAVLKAQEYINAGYNHIVDIDLKSFFDEVDHCILLQLLFRKIKCPLTLRLIRKWLRTPIMIKGKLVKQGGALRKYPVGIFSERARLQGWRRSTGKPP